MTSAAPQSLLRARATPRANPVSALWSVCRSEGVEWLVRQDCQQELLGPGGLLSAADWRRSAAAAVVKSGPHRAVYRLTLPSGEFYLKHFKAADWRAVLSNLLQSSRAERELSAARKLAALRLPTFQPVAIGRARRGGVTTDAWLVSRGIAEAVPLDQFLRDGYPSLPLPQQCEVRQQIARELGRLAARLHQAGVEHVDFHAGNVLIRPDAVGSDGWLALIDLHAVRFRRGLSRPRREQSLAALHQAFAGQSTRTDRRRFWLAYRHELVRRPERETPAANLIGARKDARRLEQFLVDAAHAGWRRADRAWRRGNRHVRKLDHGAVGCRGLALLEADRLAEIRGDPEFLFRSRLVRWIKQSGRRRVAEVSVPELAEQDSVTPSGPARLAVFDPERSPGQAILKCIVERGLFARWRESPVRRAWEMGHALLRRGIQTPRPLLYVESPAPAGRRLYLLSEKIEDSRTLAEFFLEDWIDLATAARRAWLSRRIRSLARQVRRLHDSGFDHRDLKFPNLLVAEDAADPRVWILDLDDLRVWRRLPRARAVQNLARLNVSAGLVPSLGAADRLRFLRQYLGAQYDTQWKRWWRAIAGRTARKINSNHSRRRPLT